MSAIEIEVFSNSQLIILTLLMFAGGEVFTSMVGLHLRKFFFKPDSENSTAVTGESSGDEFLRIKFLGFVVLCYLSVIHLFGVGFVLIYFIVTSSAKEILEQKGLNLVTFSIFTAVSTLASCGFVPTNENMIVFRGNSGLLLILIPQILLGNTLYPSCLRFCIWVIGKFKNGDSESNYLLKNSEEIGFFHLLPGVHSFLLAVTVFGFILIQFILICAMEWNSEVMRGMNSYEKIIGILFLSTSSRHTGESIVDISAFSSAVLILFVVMMYLPPYTSFLPLENNQTPQKARSREKAKIVENFLWSQLCYLVIFTIIICIAERKKIVEDPLNFSALNIVLEVISAYGNVGFSTGYSCERQLHPQNDCVDKWFGFSGRWSDEGKIILIFVMIFGRLKKFNMNGGKSWKLL